MGPGHHNHVEVSYQNEAPNKVRAARMTKLVTLGATQAPWIFLPGTVMARREGCRDGGDWQVVPRLCGWGLG